MPAHLLTHHPRDIKLRQMGSEHCIYGDITYEREDMAFCVCLTCKKGIMQGPEEGQGARWVAIHAKQTDCRAAHKEALQRFRQSIVMPDVSGQVDPLTFVWEECKSDAGMRPIITEVEQFCRDMDTRFDPAEGVKQLARTATYYKKQTALSKAQIEKMVSEHSQELYTQRCIAMQQKRDIDSLQAATVIQKAELEELRARLAALEATKGINSGI